jgi:23S rRNA A2030 N6-methylase RlmJ
LGENMTAGRYDHQTKAGNEGDVVKHPALVAALNGLLAEHEGVFRLET